MYAPLTQKHILFKILMYLVTSPNVSDPKRHMDELLLRENSAKLLARLVEK